MLQIRLFWEPYLKDCTDIGTELNQVNYLLGAMTVAKSLSILGIIVALSTLLFGLIFIWTRLRKTPSLRGYNQGGSTEEYKQTRSVSTKLTANFKTNS